MTKSKRRKSRYSKLTNSNDLETNKAIFECISDDLPDGAYLAMAEEFGLDPEDL